MEVGSKSLRSAVGSPPANWRVVIFTLAEARRALPYVARAVRDVAEAYNQTQTCRHLLAAAATSGQRGRVTQDRDAAIRMLNASIDECNAVGVDLLDLEHGVVRFAALVDDRPVSLIWRLGEPVAGAWANIVGAAPS